MISIQKRSFRKYAALSSLFIFSAIFLFSEDRFLRHARSQYEKKNYLTAADSYQKALKYAKGEFTAADYYQLASSLKETKKFSDAIPHFETAIMNNHDRGTALLIDIAGMYSMAKNEKPAQKYIRQAVNLDAGLLKSIQNDPSLVFVRSQPGWATFHETLKAVSAENFTREDLLSILTFRGKEKGNELNTWLCSNGRAVQTRTLGSCNKGYVMGKWETSNGRINLTYDRECVHEGIGNKTKSSGSLTCDGFDYQHYVPKCGGSSEVLYLAAHTIADARRGKKPEVGLFNTKFSVEFRPMAKDPVQCSPDFKPSKIQEMKVE